MKSLLVVQGAVLSIFAATLGACGGGGASSSGTGGTAASSSSSGGSSSSGTTTSTTTGPTDPVIKTVFTILLENHDYNEVVGSTNAPYINGTLIAQYGLATNYMDSGIHPSLPNYLYLTSGNTFYNGLGVFDFDPTQSAAVAGGPQFPVSSDNLGNQLQVAGIPWRAYEESMGTACTLVSAGNFACRHDPFLYYADIQKGAGGLCAKTNVDYAGFAADLAADTYRYIWLTPNLLDDGHDPSSDPVTALKQTDTWLSTEVPKILASPAWQKGGVLFITWDEAEGRNGDSKDQVPMIVVTPAIKSPGYKSNVAYTHANYLATVEDIFGLPRLGDAVGKASMKEFWGE